MDHDESKKDSTDLNDEETLKDIVERIRALEDFINEMIDAVLPKEDHFCTSIFDCTLEEFKESRELERLNYICNKLDSALESNDSNDLNDTNDMNDESDDFDTSLKSRLTKTGRPEKYVNDFQSLVFDLERSFLVLELFWSENSLQKLDYSHLELAIKI